MFIDLSGLDGYKYTVNRSVYAYVKEQKLYVTKNIPFEKLMVAMAYRKHGNQCFYCGKKFSKKVEKTIDHVFPEMFGGITILPNLVPCCTVCNQEKSNLTGDEYIEWKSIEDKEARDKFRLQCLGKHELEKIKRGTIIPKDWFEKKKLTILADIDPNVTIKSKKHDEARRFFWKYGKIEHPIVSSRNCYLLDGFTTLWVAKEEGINKPPVIRLENVVVITK